MLVAIENIGAFACQGSMRMDFEFYRTIWSYTDNEYFEKILISLAAPLLAHSVANDCLAQSSSSFFGTTRFLISSVHARKGRNKTCLPISATISTWKKWAVCRDYRRTTRVDVPIWIGYSLRRKLGSPSRKWRRIFCVN